MVVVYTNFDTTPFHELVDRLNEPVTLFSFDDIRCPSRWGNQSVDYRDPLEPNIELLYFAQEASSRKINPPIHSRSITFKRDDTTLHSTTQDVKRI